LKKEKIKKIGNMMMIKIKIIEEVEREEDMKIMTIIEIKIIIDLEIIMQIINIKKNIIEI
jgi:hypothetical protein